MITINKTARGHEYKRKMAKKKQQQQQSKKAEQKKKNQQIEDRTFGLKNKNKSKKVQNYVRSVTNSVNNTGDRKLRAEEERRKRAKEEQKLRKKQMKDEANALFNEGEFGQKYFFRKPALLILTFIFSHALHSTGSTQQKENKF